MILECIALPDSSFLQFRSKKDNLQYFDDGAQQY